MWSEAFDAEERAGRSPEALSVGLTIVALLAGLAAVVGEVVLSLEVTSLELTSRVGSWPMGFLALGLGFLGPYAAMLALRTPPRPGRPPVRRGAVAGLVAIATGGMAIGWLLLIRSTLHATPSIL